MSREVPSEQHYADRAEAGRRLAGSVAHLAGRRGLIVLGLPRGGMAVARPVAERRGAPLDVMVVRKLGVPGQSELAFGAVASGGIRVILSEIVDSLLLPHSVIEQVSRRETEELLRRERLFRGDRPAADLDGKTVLLIDDGVATGSTARAAIRACRKAGAVGVIFAAPVASPQALRALRADADEVICPLAPWEFMAVGQWYDDFTQVTDDDVRRLLAAGDGQGGRGDAGGKSPIQPKES